MNLEHVFLGILITINSIIAWTGLQILRQVSRDTLEIAAMTKAGLDALARLSSALNR